MTRKDWSDLDEFTTRKSTLKVSLARIRFFCSLIVTVSVSAHGPPDLHLLIGHVSATLKRKPRHCHAEAFFHRLALASGLLSVGFGLVVAYQILVVNGLLTTHPHWVAK